MARTRKGRTTAALAAVVILVLIGMSWRWIIAAYHLIRLRDDPDRVWALCERDRTPSEDAALTWFVETSPGDRWLAGRFLEHVFLRHVAEPWFIRGQRVLLLIPRRGALITLANGATGASVRLREPYTGERYLWTLELIRRVRKPIHLHVRRPSAWEVRIEPVTREALRRFGESEGWLTYAGLTHMCMFRLAARPASAMSSR